jgi:predicted transcriptional regulator
MSSKRDRLEIIHDILEVIRDKGTNVKPTHIMYKSNLSHQMLTEYLDELIKNGLVEEEERDRKKRYALTKKGFSYLEDYSTIRGFLDSYGLL